MTFTSLRTICTTSVACLSLVAFLSPALSQDAGTPLVKESKGDTLHLSCEQSRSLVKGTGGTVLTSGPYHYDLYHVGGGTCGRLHEEMQPAFVRAKDTPLCFVGYTCEERANSAPSN